MSMSRVHHRRTGGVGDEGVIPKFHVGEVLFQSDGSIVSPTIRPKNILDLSRRRFFVAIDTRSSSPAHFSFLHPRHVCVEHRKLHPSHYHHLSIDYFQENYQLSYSNNEHGCDDSTTPRFRALEFYSRWDCRLGRCHGIFQKGFDHVLGGRIDRGKCLDWIRCLDYSQ